MIVRKKMSSQTVIDYHAPFDRGLTGNWHNQESTFVKIKLKLWYACGHVHKVQNTLILIYCIDNWLKCNMYLNALYTHWSLEFKQSFISILPVISDQTQIMCTVDLRSRSRAQVISVESVLPWPSRIALNFTFRDSIQHQLTDHKVLYFKQKKSQSK